MPWESYQNMRSVEVLVHFPQTLLQLLALLINYETHAISPQKSYFTWVLVRKNKSMREKKIIKLGVSQQNSIDKKESMLPTKEFNESCYIPTSHTLLRISPVYSKVCTKRICSLTRRSAPSGLLKEHNQTRGARP